MDNGTGDADATVPPDQAASAQSFYTRWARAYDLLARHAPGVRTLRARAVRALAPDRGDTVLDLGCGTGANLRFLREAVGPDGRVVGVDFAPGPVVVARRHASEWDNVHVVRADATRLPTGGLDTQVGAEGVDAVLASFVVGMLPTARDAVRDWAGLVGPGGRLALLDLARSTRPAGRLVNPLFRAAVLATSPPGTHERNGGDTVRVLDERVAAAHRTLAAACPDRSRSTHVLGFVRLSAGQVR